MVRYRDVRYNRRRKSRGRLLLLVGLLCLVPMASLVYFAQAVAKKKSNLAASPIKQVAPRPPQPHAVNYGLPVRLKIAKIAIDAPITYVGLTKTGAMDAPGNVDDVGWYKGGTLPGNKGSAVLAGHIDGLRGEPGVFASLSKLQKGDKLQVVDSNNSVITFMVSDVRTYGQDERPNEVFNVTDGAHLNLITCTGAWDKAQRHFLERLVVFTDKM